MQHRDHCFKITIMKYIIIHEGRAFLTNYFDKENLYVDGMFVINTKDRTYTNDGTIWHELEEDSL